MEGRDIKDECFFLIIRDIYALERILVTIEDLFKNISPLIILHRQHGYSNGIKPHGQGKHTRDLLFFGTRYYKNTFSGGVTHTKIVTLITKSKVFFIHTNIYSHIQLTCDDHSTYCLSV